MRISLMTLAATPRTLRRSRPATLHAAGLKASTCVVSATLAAVAFTATAQAADIRYVSAAGSNKSKCSLAAPCRSLQRGINKTPAGGELRVLNSGFYGNGALIDKSITISGGGDTIILGGPISIADAGATVVLRGLALNGGGGTGLGIHITEAAAVHIERCVVQGYPQSGIFLDGADTELFVADSIVRDNGGLGLSVDGSGAAARVTVDNSRFENNVASGVFVFGPVSSAINRSLSAGNGEHGFAGLGSAGFMVVAQSTAVNNGTSGYFNGGGATLTLDSSVAHGNGTGIWNPSGIVRSRGNNTVINNTANVTGSLTPLGGV